MKKAIIISVLLLPLLTGCAFLDFFKKKDETTTLGSTKIVVIDSEVLRECDPMPRIENPNPTQEELDAQKFVWIDKFGQCANRQSKSIKAIKKLANIEDSK